MNEKTRGIILSVSEYREHDLLLKVQSEDYGLLTFIAKGSLKMSSHHHYLPLNMYEFLFDYREDRDIFIIKSAKLLKTFFDERKMKLLAFKNILTSVLVKSHEALEGNFFNELLFVLEHMDESNKYLLGGLFFSCLLKRSGLTPVVDGCAVCGNDKVIGLSNEYGGFLCKDHALEKDVLDVLRLKKFRLIVKAGFEHYDLIKNNEYDFKDFSLLCEFYLENTGINLPAYDFYKEL